MAWFDSTSAILGVKGLEQQKKNDRWSKLMDIANILQNTAGLGADIWKTISGRKHDYGMASTTQGYNLELASVGQGYAKEQFDWRAGFDAAEAEKDREWRANQSALDRALDERLSAAQMAAQMGDRSEKRMSFLAEWAQRAYELAVSNPSFLGADGTFDPAKREALRKFLYTQVEGLPNLSDEEIAWAKKSFDGFVDGLGASPTAAPQEAAKVTPKPPATDLLAKAKETAVMLAGMALPPEVKNEVNKLYGWLPAPGAPGGRGPAGVTVQDILTKLTTIYNTYKYQSGGGNTGQVSGDLRVIK